MSPDGIHFADIRSSAGGRRIFVSLRRENDALEVVGQVPFETTVVVATMGTRPRTVSVQVPRSGDVESLDWSTDGSRLVYGFRDADDGTSALFSISLTDARPRQLTSWDVN